MRPSTAPASRPLALEYLAVIAEGPTARVDLCRATDAGGRLVAVKRLHPEFAEDGKFVTRFLDEVWMTSALKHPNVVEVAGWGTDEQGLYLAVELVQGVSLARLMKTVKDTGEAFSERMVVFVASCLCRGLAAAHSLRSAEGRALGLVHRDLTPGNVLLGFNGDVKITDFGLAKAKERLSSTTVGISARPSVQMAPEEMDGAELDHRSDIFAVGVLLFELLSARHPFTGANEIETLEHIATAAPPDLFELRPKVNKDIVGIVMRCLEKSPAARPQSAGALLGPLVQWLETRGYGDDNGEVLARFVRRNAMRQMGWFERVIAGDHVKAPENVSDPEPTGDIPTGRTQKVEDRSAATVVVKRPAAAAAPATATAQAPAARGSREGDRDWEIATLVHRREESTEELSLADAEIVDPRSDDDEDYAPTVAMRRATAGVVRGAMLRSASRPKGVALPAASPSSAAREPPAVDPRIQAEADRLRRVAAQWAEQAARASSQARAAAAEAERTAELARIAGEAAVLAGQAVEIARATGADEGARRLARALELERSLDQVAREPTSS